MWWTDEKFEDLMASVDLWLGARGDTIEIVATSHTTTVNTLEAPDKIHVLRRHYYSIVYKRVFS